MIKIENTDVYGFEAAIRGMRNPMNSWSKSDSEICDMNCERCETKIYQPCECEIRNGEKISGFSTELFVIGRNDYALMKKLVKAGTDHSKFMRMINFTCDIIAPLYWWKEFDTYKVGTVRNSCSTMHKIADKEFTLDDFSCEHLENYGTFGHFSTKNFFDNFEDMIDTLNAARELYLQSNDKQYWWQMIQLLPSSYNQRSTVQLNYQVLRSIYHARKNHKLDEWKEFCKWVEGLPYSELITARK